MRPAKSGRLMGGGRGATRKWREKLAAAYSTRRMRAPLDADRVRVRVTGQRDSLVGPRRHARGQSYGRGGNVARREYRVGEALILAIREA